MVPNASCPISTLIKEILVNDHLSQPAYWSDIKIYISERYPRELIVQDGVLDIPEWLRLVTCHMLGMDQMRFWSGIGDELCRKIFGTIQRGWPKIDAHLSVLNKNIEISIFGDWSLVVTTAQFSTEYHKSPTGKNGLYAVLKFNGKDVIDQKHRCHRDVKRDLFYGVREIMAEVEYLRQTLPETKQD